VFFVYGMLFVLFFVFFFQAEDGIRDFHVTGVQTCALPIFHRVGAAACATAALDSRVSEAAFRTSAAFPLACRARKVPPHDEATRSEERRVGKECRSRWWPYQ